ncbi:MAG: hypothetical protein QW165_02275 [Candidatus Woesearchaeota archaeon]
MKRGFELGIGMIVLIILSILIFSLSLYFLFKWFGSAEELKAEIDRSTREQIITALKSGNQLVAIPNAIRETKRGSAATFGVGIRNLAAEKQFSMAASFSGAYMPNGNVICRTGEPCAFYIEKYWLGGFATTPTFTLKKNEEKVIPQLIKADLNIDEGRTTPKGDYTFNLCVYDAPLRSDGSPPAPCTAGQFNNNPAAFYTAKIYQVTVKVV